MGRWPYHLEYWRDASGAYTDDFVVEYFEENVISQLE